MINCGVVVGNRLCVSILKWRWKSEELETAAVSSFYEPWRSFERDGVGIWRELVGAGWRETF